MKIKNRTRLNDLLSILKRYGEISDKTSLKLKKFKKITKPKCLYTYLARVDSITQCEDCVITKITITAIPLRFTSLMRKRMIILKYRKENSKDKKLLLAGLFIGAPGL